MRLGLSRYALMLCLTLGIWQIAQVGWFHSKAWLAGVLIERAWLETLSGERKVRPWPWADTWPVAEISVPGLGIRQIILSGDSGRILAFAPGYTQSSALRDNQVHLISAHRDTHFTFLKELQLGDQIILKTHDRETQFEVREAAIVDAREYLIDVERILNEQLADKSILLLATCYPFDAFRAGGHQRYLVLADQKITD